MQFFAATRTQFDDRPSYSTLALQNGLDCHNFSRLIDNHLSISFINLVDLVQ